jgi:hypothetical protein
MEVTAYPYGSWHNFSHRHDFLEVDAYRHRSYHPTATKVAEANIFITTSITTSVNLAETSLNYT